MDFYSFECLNHSNVTFGMPHANSIDFNIASQYISKVKFFGSIEISYSWIREHFSDPPFYLDPPTPRLLIFRLSVGTPPFPPSLLLRFPLLFGTGE